MRRCVDELTNGPCWFDRENSLRYSPRVEFWPAQGQRWHELVLGRGW